MPGRTENETASFRLRHLRLGWISLFVFIALGAVLESMHGFKVDWYLNVSNETRRLMFTLAHSHGALLGILHIAFGFLEWSESRNKFGPLTPTVTGLVSATSCGIILPFLAN